MADLAAPRRTGVTPPAAAPAGRGSSRKLSTRLVQVAFVAPAVLYLLLGGAEPAIGAPMTEGTA